MNILHTYPVNDLHPHTINSRDCACRPRVLHLDGGIMIVHNSYDGREILENCEVCNN